MPSPPPTPSPFRVSPAGTSNLAEVRGGMGGAWRVGGGWMEFMGCGEAAGPDPARSPAPILGLDSLRPGCAKPHASLPPGPGPPPGGKGTPGKTPSPSNSPLPFAARALTGAQPGPVASASLSLPGQDHAAGAQRRGWGPGVAPRAGHGTPLRSSNAAAWEAACRPCRTGALLSLVWNFYPPRKPQAGAGAVGSGSRRQAVWPLGESSGA